MLSLLSLLQAVISLSVVTLIAVWCWVQWRFRRQILFARQLPTVLPAFPLLGHLPYMRTSAKIDHNVVKLLTSRCDKGISCLWMGPIPFIVLKNSEDLKVVHGSPNLYLNEVLKIVLNNSRFLEKSALYKVAKCFLGDGLITAPVNIWRKSRKQIEPMFSALNIKQLVPLFNDSARHLVQALSKHVGGGSFDVQEHVFDFTLVNILRIIYGPDFKISPDDYATILKGANVLPTTLAQRSVNPFLMPDFSFRLLKRQNYKLLQNMQNCIKELNKKTSKGDRSINQWVEEDSKQDKEGRTILDAAAILKSDPDFSEDYIDKEIITLITAGTDTNAITISSFLLAIATHPSIQERLYNEIISVVGGDYESVTIEDINRMPYLDQVLKETLRRFSVTPVIGRRSDKDLKLNEYTIPKDVTVLLSLCGLLHDPDVYPDPLRFDPDRFSPENVAKRDNYSFLPFSGGPRGCVGKAFAMVVMKIALVQVVRRYEFRSDVEIDDVIFEYGLAINSKTGYQVSVKRRSVN